MTWLLDNVQNKCMPDFIRINYYPGSLKRPAFNSHPCSCCLEHTMFMLSGSGFQYNRTHTKAKSVSGITKSKWHVCEMHASWIFLSGSAIDSVWHLYLVMCHSDLVIMYHCPLLPLSYWLIVWNRRIKDPEDNQWIMSIGLGGTERALGMKKEEVMEVILASIEN